MIRRKRDMELIYFVAGLAIGAIVGVLIYRNNAKKIERETKEKISSIKHDIQKLREIVDESH